MTGGKKRTQQGSRLSCLYGLNTKLCTLLLLSFWLSSVLSSSPTCIPCEAINGMKQDICLCPGLSVGNQQRRSAQEAYLGFTSQEHVDLYFTLAELHVNPIYPHVGATIDGIVSCDCCGNGITDIKCPYKHCDSHPKVIHVCI